MQSFGRTLSLRRTDLLDVQRDVHRLTRGDLQPTLLLLAAVLLAAMVANSGGDIGLWALALPLSIAWPLASAVLERRRRAEAVRQGLGDGLARHYNVCRDGILVESEAERLWLRWGAVTTWAETGPHFLCFAGRRLLSALPKRAFGEDVGQVRAMFTAHVLPHAPPQQAPHRMLAVVSLLIFVGCLVGRG